MKYRVFPNTDVRVSEVGFGTWTVSTGWWGDHTDANVDLQDARNPISRPAIPATQDA